MKAPCITFPIVYQGKQNLIQLTFYFGFSSVRLNWLCSSLAKLAFAISIVYIRNCLVNVNVFLVALCFHARLIISGCIESRVCNMESFPILTLFIDIQGPTCFLVSETQLFLISILFYYSIRMCCDKRTQYLDIE